MKLEPILLKDKTRLQEIYDLRVDVWENSEKREFVNKQLFPNGWFDELDETAHHWIITNDDDKIMADLIRFMCRLRPNTIGLRKRIEAEAALIELADSPVPPADILKIMV